MFKTLGHKQTFVRDGKGSVAAQKQSSEDEGWTERMRRAQERREGRLKHLGVNNKSFASKKSRQRCLGISANEQGTSFFSRNREHMIWWRGCRSVWLMVCGKWAFIIRKERGWGKKQQGKSNKSVNEVFYARMAGMYFGNVRFLNVINHSLRRKRRNDCITEAVCKVWAASLAQHTVGVSSCRGLNILCQFPTSQRQQLQQWRFKGFLWPQICQAVS